MNIRKLQRRANWHPRWGARHPWGARCSTYAPGCICCEVWRRYYETGRFPSWEEIRPTVEQHSQDSKAFVELSWNEVIKGGNA